MYGGGYAGPNPAVGLAGSCANGGGQHCANGNANCCYAYAYGHTHSGAQRYLGGGFAHQHPAAGAAGPMSPARQGN